MGQTKYREVIKILRKYIKDVDKTLQVSHGKSSYPIIEITNNNGDNFTEGQKLSLKKLELKRGSNFSLITCDDFKDYMEKWNLKIPQE